MPVLAANAGSYPRVGDKPGQQILRKTLDLWERKKASNEELEEAVKTMMQAALDEQNKAGLDVVTDGQVRWYDPISHLLRGASNVEIGGLLRLFDTNFYFRQPALKGPIKWSRPVTVEDFTWAKAHSKKPVKAVLTGPFTLSAHALVSDGTATALADLTAYVAAEVEALAAAGASWIQIDEPSILKRPSDFGSFAESVKAVAARKGKAKLVLATCWGDAAPLVGRLVELPVDGLAFDFTYTATLGDALTAASPRKILQLGLVDARNTRLEKSKDVARAAEKIAKKSKADVVLAPSAGLEFLPRDRAFDKLKVLAQAKKLIKG